MATPDPSDKVKDKEYSNWLKVTLALYYMKSGLHTFIQSEINCLHQSLVQKIYAGQKVQPCTTCNASCARRNKHTGVWKFQTQCKLSCDVWFDELLALHNNPKSDKIYWANSNVSLWPSNPWESAKVFLPRGQLSTNTGPAESDAQALMVLLANCKHFHPKLSQQGQTLTHSISTIRNNIMHNGEMKVSDADKTNFIQQIIQLLEDPVHLQSLDDCKAAVSNIHKIENDSLDVFFNVDTEMKVLKAAVNELRLEHGTLEKILNTIDSLKEEYKHHTEQLTEQFEKRFEENAQAFGRKLEELETNILTQRENNSHRIRTAGGEGVSNWDKSEAPAMKKRQESDGLRQLKKKLHRSVLKQCLPELMSCLDFRNVSIYIQQKELLDDVTMRDISEGNRPSDNIERLIQWIQQRGYDTYTTFKECLVLAKQENLKDMLEEEEENLKVMLEKEEERVANDMDIEATTRRKRPESDGLRQLKNQTEDDLDTFRKMGFIPTSQTEEAKKLLQEKRSVVIKGNPGEGKTSTALHLINNNNYTDQRVMIIRPEQWEKVDTDWVKIVILEDIFGQYDIDIDRLQKWIDTYLQKIQNHVDEGKLQVIITIRNDIFLKAFSKLKSFELFRCDRSLTLCSDKLQKADKNSILDRELKRKNKAKDMSVNKIEQCIINFKGLIGFPQCCTLFAGNKDLFVQGPDFFKSPEKFLVDNIRNLKADSLLALAFLFCVVEIEEEYLSPSQIKEYKNYLQVLQEIAKCLKISIDESTIIALRQSYEHYSGLYVKKVSSCQDGKNWPYVSDSGMNINKSCIQFSHATVYEAVGQVLGDTCPEMVVKYGDSGYLYRRTYAADAKDNVSQNVFIPVSVYGVLVERMVHDVVEKRIINSVVKHSALKQNKFVKKLKDELPKVNRIRDFLMADPYSKHRNFRDVLEGHCRTFLQCVLQSDEDAVKLVYNHLMEFLACTHNNKGHNCWQCEEKQTLLELALYYHHFEIADQLITVNACYTHVSLCNAARHGKLKRVQTILEDLKMRQVFDPDCTEAEHTLYRAYISGNQNVIETLLQEGITLHHCRVIDAVLDGDINVLIKVVEHLKLNKNWYPHLEEDMRGMYFFPLDKYSHLQSDFVNEMHCSTKALYIAYCKDKFDMADYLMKNETKVTLDMLRSVSEHSSQQAVARVIQNLKDTGTWDPHCNIAYKALETAYRKNKHDVCDLLFHEGVSLKMKNLSGVINTHEVSLESVEKLIQHLKDTHSWDSKCNDASKALQTAYLKDKADVCDLLIHEGVSLTMKDLAGITSGDILGLVNIITYRISLKSIKKSIQHLKDNGRWNPRCEEASNAFIKAYETKGYEICSLLIEEGVSCAIHHFHVVTLSSLDLVKKTVKQLKDTDSWDAKCPFASKALEVAYSRNKHDVCQWLIQEGVSLTMRNLAHVTSTDQIPLESIKEIIKHLKATDCWDPKSVHAYEALEKAYVVHRYDVCDLLIQEGISLTMNSFLNVTKMRLFASIQTVKKIIQHLKNIDSWDPRCDDASEALEVTFIRNHFPGNDFDVFDLLFQEGVSLKMKHLPYMIKSSQDVVKTAVKNLKDTNSWDAKCDDACKALATAYVKGQYDVCQLLIQEGVSLTMKNLHRVISTSRDYLNHFRAVRVSLESVKKAIQHLKDTDSWDAKCDDASKALVQAYREELYDVCQLLIHKGVSLTMKNLPGVFITSRDYLNHFRTVRVSLESVKKAIQHLKDTDSWDAKCDDASKALVQAYREELYGVCQLLIHEGVSLTMKNFPGVISTIGDNFNFHWNFRPFKSVQKTIQHMKNTGSWDPKCIDASKALERAYMVDKYGTCYLLMQEGVPLTMKCLCYMPLRSIEDVKTTVQQLKDTDSWDTKCNEASEALEKAFREEKNDVCDLLIQEGVTLTMKNLPDVMLSESMELVQKAVQHLKDTNSWDAKCNEASEALKVSFFQKKYDMCDLLIQEGVTLTVKNLSAVMLSESLESVQKAVQHLKDNDSWDPKCDDASKALEEAYGRRQYDVCHLLIQEGVSLTVSKLASIFSTCSLSLDEAKKIIQHLKDTESWDPKCDHALKALEVAYAKRLYDVQDLLIQEGVLHH